MTSPELDSQPDVNQSYEIREHLFRLGMLSRASLGIQVDINAATQKYPDGAFSDAPLCDHNCRTQTAGKPTGNYDCPAAATLNLGLTTRSLAPAELILRGVENSVIAGRRTNNLLAKSSLAPYFEQFQIPPDLRTIIQDHLVKGDTEVNVFGGNPELHPDVIAVIRELKSAGYIVNLTTTGGRLLRSPGFASEVIEVSPDVIAVSADDFQSPDQISSLASLGSDQIKRLWQSTPFVHGQRRKAIEAAFVANLSHLTPRFPTLLFNLVIHPGNINSIDSIIKALTHHHPNAKINPFPAQSAFLHSQSVFGSEQLDHLESFIDTMVSEHSHPESQIVRRLHYWLMLKAVFLAFPDNQSEILRHLSGYDTWKCYLAPGANRYIQIGASPETHDGTKIAGGHLSCFWNPRTIPTIGRQTWNMGPAEIEKYLNGGITEIAGRKPHPCPGCLFPRLNFDVISTELGMQPSLIPTYLTLRKFHAGY